MWAPQQTTNFSMINFDIVSHVTFVSFGPQLDSGNVPSTK